MCVRLLYTSTVHPVFHLSPANSTVTYGSNLTLACSVTSFPALISLVWKHRYSGDHRFQMIPPTSSKQLPPQAASLLLYNWTITLELRRAVERDAGEYLCVATYAREPSWNATSRATISRVFVNVHEDTRVLKDNNNSTASNSITTATSSSSSSSNSSSSSSNKSISNTANSRNAIQNPSIIIGSVTGACAFLVLCAVFAWTANKSRKTTKEASGSPIATVRPSMVDEGQEQRIAALVERITSFSRGSHRSSRTSGSSS